MSTRSKYERVLINQPQLGANVIRVHDNKPYSAYVNWALALFKPKQNRPAFNTIFIMGQEDLAEKVVTIAEVIKMQIPHLY
jgi:hypothetical protein